MFKKMKKRLIRVQLRSTRKKIMEVSVSSRCARKAKEIITQEATFSKNNP
jgi:uncharacterized membrane protein